MNFGANKKSIKVSKEGAFCGTYFRDIYSGVNEKWFRKSWKEFDQLKDIDQKYFCSRYYDVSVNKYGAKCRTSNLMIIQFHLKLGKFCCIEVMN